MKTGCKRFIFIAIGIILLLSLIVCGYIINRKVEISNNDVLNIYEQYTPEIYTSKISSITYYEYVLDHGKVICQYEPENSIAVGDYKRGFAKEYRNNVLKDVSDLRTEKLYKMFSLDYTLPTKFIRSDEECDAIGELLKSKDYKTIETKWGGKIFTTTSGTVFVN